MSTLYCALENRADLYVKERQEIRHYRARSAEERRRRKKKKNAKSQFFTSRGAYVKLRYIAMLYTHSIGNQPYKNTMVVFKMCDSVHVPSARYSSVCNVLCLWSISLITTYRVYRLYDYMYNHVFNTLASSSTIKKYNKQPYS